MFVTDFVQIFCFWSSFLAAELTRTRGHKWVVVRSGLLLFFVVQIVSFLQCSIFLKIKNPWLDLSLPKQCVSACHSCWLEASWTYPAAAGLVCAEPFFGTAPHRGFWSVHRAVQKCPLSACAVVFSGQGYLQDSALSIKSDSSRRNAAHVHFIEALCIGLENLVSLKL